MEKSKLRWRLLILDRQTAASDDIEVEVDFSRMQHATFDDVAIPNEEELLRPLPDSDNAVVISVDASFNSLRSLKVQWFSHLDSLEQLNLMTNCITELHVPSSMHWRRLRYLNLSENRISEATMLESLRGLEHLDLSFNAIRSTQSLPQLPKLQSLVLTGNTLKDTRSFSTKFPVLKRLEGLENFEGFHKLERLGAAENELPSVATVKRIISGMKVLVDLDLHGNPLEAEPQWRLQLLQHAKLKRLNGAGVNIFMRDLLSRVGQAQDLKGLIASGVERCNKIVSVERERLDADLERLDREKSKLLENFEAFERKMEKDLAECVRYLEEHKPGMASTEAVLAKGLAVFEETAGQRNPVATEEIKDMIPSISFETNESVTDWQNKWSLPRKAVPAIDSGKANKNTKTEIPAMLDAQSAKGSESKSAGSLEKKSQSFESRASREMSKSPPLNETQDEAATTDSKQGQSDSDKAEGAVSEVDEKGDEHPKEESKNGSREAMRSSSPTTIEADEAAPASDKPSESEEKAEEPQSEHRGEGKEGKEGWKAVQKKVKGSKGCVIA